MPLSWSCQSLFLGFQRKACRIFSQPFFRFPRLSWRRWCWTCKGIQVLRKALVLTLSVPSCLVSAQALEAKSPCLLSGLHSQSRCLVCLSATGSHHHLSKSPLQIAYLVRTRSISSLQYFGHCKFWDQNSHQAINRKNGKRDDEWFALGVRTIDQKALQIYNRHTNYNCESVNNVAESSRADH